MLRFRLKVEVLGDNGVVWWEYSDPIEGDNAKETREMVNKFSDLKMFSFWCKGQLVFLNRGVLDRSVITVEELDAISD